MRKTLPVLMLCTLISGCLGVPGAPAPIERGEDQPAPDPAAVGDVLVALPKANEVAEASEVAETQEGAEPAAKAQPPQKRGFFSRVKRSVADLSAERTIAAQPEEEAEAAPAPEAKPEGVPRQRRGLFGRRKAEVETATSAPSGPDVLLPFGQVAVACGLGRRALGHKIETSGKYTLYDAAPGSTGSRNFFVTGFKDGCARQATGAVALFGAIDVYEVLYYGGGGAAPGMAETDRAYRKLRARSCPAKGPCSERGVQKLSRATAFLSVYAAAGQSRQMEMLLHAGKLEAQAVK